MREVLAAQGVADSALRDRLVRLSAGSPGQALALADEALWQQRRALLEGLTAPRPDSVGLARNWTDFAEDAGKETALHRRRAWLLLRLLIEALCDALHLQLGAPVRSCAPDEQALLRTLADRASSTTILALIERCLQAELQLGRYIQVSLVLEGLMDSLCPSLAA